MGIDIDIFTWSLDADPARLHRCRQVLSADEQDRAARFVSDRLAQRYCIARGTLRQILAGYVEQAAPGLEFHYNKQGKPGLTGGPHFNLSHSGSTAALAVCRAAPVGIDIEYWRPVEEGLARRFFSNGEIAELSALPPAQQEAGFFACWTRKEAVIKAVGLGLSMPLDAFDVTLTPGRPAVLTRLEHDDLAAGDWALHDLPFAEGLSGALAVQSRGHGVKLSVKNQ